MMCYMCNKQINYSRSRKVDGKWVDLCNECAEKLHINHIEEKLQTVNHPRDFKEWDMGDMSDAFWLHLGKYKNHPNKRSLSIMNIAFCWACHADHGLSSSFYHALKWCGIDLAAEFERTDLPDM